MHIMCNPPNNSNDKSKDEGQGAKAIGDVSKKKMDDVIDAKNGKHTAKCWLSSAGPDRGPETYLNVLQFFVAAVAVFILSSFVVVLAFVMSDVKVMVLDMERWYTTRRMRLGVVGSEGSAGNKTTNWAA